MVLGAQVEDLAAVHLGAYRMPVAAGSPPGCAVQEPRLRQLTRPNQQLVTEQYGHGTPELRWIAHAVLAAMPVLELSVGCRPAAAGVGVVQHVVVDEHAHVQQLDRGDRLPIPASGASRSPAAATKPQ